MQRKFMGTLWNTYAFFSLYASIDNYNPLTQKADKDSFSLMDKWVLSKLNSLVQFVDEGLGQYKITETARAISDFTDELSNWYVRRCRERFWGKGMEGDKLAAFETLYTVLKTLTGLCAPYIPFMTETMYQNLVVNVDEAAPISVHLTDFPKADLSLVDKELEKQMEEVIEAVQLGRACRNAANIKVRQPIAAMYIKGAKLSDEVAELIADELNVKAVNFVTDARDFTTSELKPQMRTLGPRYGKLLGKIGAALKTMDGNDVVDAFARGEKVTFDVNGTTVELSESDVLTRPMQKPGFVAQMDGDMTVVLDTNLTPELIEEGYVREVISKIQTMRKDADFDVTDRIKVQIIAKGKLTDIVNGKSADIMGSVLAVELSASAMEGELSKKVAGIVKGAEQETLTGAALVEALGLDLTADAVQCWNINGANAVIAVTVSK